MLYFQIKSFIGVYYRGVILGQYPWEIMSVVEVNMAVYKKPGLILIHQLGKALKASVGIVISVAVSRGRCMSQYDIHSAGSADFSSQLFYV